MVVIFVVGGGFYWVIVLLEVVFINVECIVVSVRSRVWVRIVILWWWFDGRGRRGRIWRRVGFFFNWERGFDVDIIFFVSRVRVEMFYMDVIFFFLIWVLWVFDNLVVDIIVIGFIIDG